MNGDGKFNGGKYTTIPETKNIKLPIGGKIRLGIRVTNEQGKEYPKELDYFVCPKEVRAVFGDEPTELTVFFPRANREEVFPQNYEKYGSNEALLCQGDGEKSAQRLNLENGRWETVKCPCEHYNKKYDKKTKIGGCVKAGYLKFMIPSVSIGTFYQCRVGGVVSIEECNSAFELAKKTTGGCWAMIPFRMRRVAKKLKIPGTANMKTHWVVTLEIAASTEEIRRVISGEILYLGQQRNKQFELETTGPAMGKETEEAIEIETEEEIQAREAEEAEKERARQEALKKEFDELSERQAKLKKEIEEGKHNLKNYKEAKAIHQKKQEEEVKENIAFATMPQVELIKTQIIGSHLFQPNNQKDKSILDMLKTGMIKSKASEIITWWRGDSKKSIVGERARREKVEKEAKPEATKEEKIKQAREIAKAPGKLEVKDKDAPFPDEKIADEDIPGSSYDNAIPF